MWMNSSESFGSFCCAQVCGDLNNDKYWYDVMDSSIHTSLGFVPVFVSILHPGQEYELRSFASRMLDYTLECVLHLITP
jgi:hypothetical protein